MPAPKPGRRRRWLQMATIDTGPLRRNRDFRLLFFGQLVSYFGTAITDVALAYQAYQLTHSSLAVGLIGLAELVPLLTLAFVGGAYADARDRRRMVLFAEFGALLLSAALAANALLPHPFLATLYVVAAIQAGLSAIRRPSLDSLLPRLVSHEEMMAAGALSSIRFQVGMVTGPALAGILLAVVGVPITYGIDVVSYAFSLAMLGAMKAVPAPIGAEKPSLRRVLEGVRYARSRPELIGTYVVDMVAMFFGMPMALFPAIAAGYGGATVLGLMYAAPMLGSLIASSTSGWASHVHRQGMGVILAAGAWGLAIVGFGLSGWLPLALLFLVLAGAADMVSGLFRTAIWNQTIPDHIRGRMAGIELIGYSSGPALGNLEAGVVAALYGVRFSVLSGGVLCVLGGAALALALPAFRAYDSRTIKPLGAAVEPSDD